MDKKIPTSFSFEIINVTPVNPYISECQIKVFYTGKNRNYSYITKEVGEKIARTLPRSPIVAYYNEEIEDYEDHGQEMIINHNGIKMITKTVPYGAVSETAPIVWQEFADPDGVVREYLVCNGYLWTGRYPHLQNVLEYNKGQSMEFFPESIEGEWANLDNEDESFFIFSEASISALCILGDDVEPCFEGASVGAPKVRFSLEEHNEEFDNEFAEFMSELDKVLNKNPEGGNAGMNDPITEPVVTEPVIDNEPTTDPVVDNEPVQTEPVEPATEPVVDNKPIDEPIVEDKPAEPVVNNTEPAEPVVNTEPAAVTEPVGPTAAEYELLQNQFNELQTTHEALKESYTALESKYNVLAEKETQRENAAKDAIFTKFAVLGEDVLEELRNNKSNFTVDELEDKLSAIAFKKGISFSLISESEGVITPNATTTTNETLPEWLQAVVDNSKN